MSQTLSVTEVARHFTEYLNRVAYRGECFVLMRGNKPIAELRYAFNLGGTTAQLLALARKRVPRQLTAQERAHYLPAAFSPQRPARR